MESRGIQRLECKLALIHRTLYESAELADSVNASGLYDDLCGIAEEVGRLQLSLRRSPGRIDPLFGDRAYL